MSFRHKASRSGKADLSPIFLLAQWLPIGPRLIDIVCTSGQIALYPNFSSFWNIEVCWPNRVLFFLIDDYHIPSLIRSVHFSETKRAQFEPFLLDVFLALPMRPADPLSWLITRLYPAPLFPGFFNIWLYRLHPYNRCMERSIDD